MCDINKLILLKWKYYITEDKMNVFDLGNRMEHYILRL